MNYLGIDYGERRIGLAYADELGIALPIAAAVEPRLEARLQHIGEAIKERRVEALVVGYPYNMDGSVGFKANEVDAFIGKLETHFGLPVHRVDERLTSQQAARDQARLGGRRQKSVAARQAARRTGDLDSRAAALILREFLESQPRDTHGEG